MRSQPRAGRRHALRAILTYHSIDPSGSVISIAEETFERHVRFLDSGRIRVLTLSDLLQDDGPDDAVALTFDDGYSNFATAAWPRLRAHGLPATVFLVSQRVGSDNRWSGRDDPHIPTMPLLDWDQAGALAADGVEIGSHTRTHPRLDRIVDDALLDEIVGSADDFQKHVGQRPTSFCYPFGAYDDRAVAAVATTYQHACTTELRQLPSAPDPHLLPRLDCYYLRRPGALEQWGTARFTSRLAVRAAVREARGAVEQVRGRRAPTDDVGRP